MRTTEILATLRLDAAQFDQAVRGSGRALDDLRKKATDDGASGGMFASALAGASRLQFATRGLQLGLTALFVKALNEGRKLKEEFDGIAAAIRNVSATSTEAVTAQEALAGIAERTNQSLTNTADLYVRITAAAEGTGRSQREILAFTEAVNRALLVGRTGAQQQAAALLQLGQALSSPRGLQGDEFRSLNENAPRLVKAIADGLGVTRGELREMSKEGRLAIEAIFGAILSQQDQLEQEAKRVPRTWAQAVQGAKDQLMLLAKDSGLVRAFASLGASLVGGVSDAIKSIRNLPTLYAEFGDDQAILAAARASGRTDSTLQAGDLGGIIAFARPNDVARELAKIQDQFDKSLLDMRARASRLTDAARPSGVLATGGRPGAPSAITFRPGAPQAGGDDLAAATLQREQEAILERERRAKQAARDAADRAKRLREEAASVRQALEQELARTTQGVAAELQVQLDQWLAEMRKKIAEGVAVDPSQLAAIKAVRQAAVDAQRAIESARPAIAEAQSILGRDSAGSAEEAMEAQAATRGLEAALATLTARRDELAAVDETKRNLTAIKELDEEREALLKLINQLLERAGKTLQLPGQGAEKVKDSLLETATAITTAVDGALALASALGRVSESGQRGLQSISLLARGAVELARTVGTADLSTGAGMASLAGAVLGVAGSLASILSGFQAEDRARAEELRRNTVALEELGKNLGDFASRNIAGDTGARLAQGLQRVLVEDMANGTYFPGRQLERQFGNLAGLIANRSGLTTAEVERAIAESGLTLQRNVGSVRQLLEFFQGDTAGYRSDFGGSLQRLEDTLRADGITDAVEVLRRRVALLSEPRTGFPAIAKALEGLDLTSAEGRATALERSRALFDQLAAGRLTLGEFGGLSVGEGRQQLLDLISALRDTTQGGPAGTGGFNESRTITEVTGSRLAGLLGTSNTLLAEIAANTAGLRVAALPTLTPPSLGALGAAAGRGGVTVVLERGAINVTIPFGAGGDAASAMALGDQLAPQLSGAIVRQLAAKLDAYLGQQGAQRRLLTGDPRLVS